MSIVLIDKEGECDIFENFEYMGLSRDKWINRIGKIIYRYFPDLKGYPVYILFSDFKNSTNEICKNSCSIYDALIIHETKNIYINTGMIRDLKHLAYSLVHELRHFHQLVNGTLSNELQESYARNNYTTTFYNSPWEIDARNYEKEVGYRCFNILKY